VQLRLAQQKSEVIRVCGGFYQTRGGSQGGGGPTEQVAQIIAVACENPQACEYPVSHWTTPLLAKEVIKRGIVESISPASVGRFLKGGAGAAASVSLLAERETGRPRGLCRRGQDRV